jgi:hypothetical protein
MDSTEIVMSSVCPSVTYFSAGIAPREPQFCTEVRWCVRLSGPEFWIRGLGVQDSGLNQDPLLRKYAFLSIT